MAKKKEEVKKEKELNIIETKNDVKSACPNCGSTDVVLNPKTGKLKCNFCRSEFDEKTLVGLEKDITKLKGENITHGARNIESDKDLVTLKCSSCGSDVVIKESESLQARCHWCRHKLSINSKVSNGGVPDLILPFDVSKDDAKESITAFFKKRRFFAKSGFKKEFNNENIMKVYLPYMLVDVNAHASFSGEGEHETRRYDVSSDDKPDMRYDANLYHVEREFDIAINSLPMESSSDKLNSASKKKTNNIINAIMPFDTENCVRFNANYLEGATSEKRDVNVSDIDDVVEAYSKDVAKIAINKELTDYDRGVHWESEEFNVIGKQWVSAYLPVWLYSYKFDNGKIHYIAVNGRNKKVMGSIPLAFFKLFIISFIMFVIGLLLMMAFYNENKDEFPNIFLPAIGIVFFIFKHYKYRNYNAKSNYTATTKNEITNLRSVDNFIKEKKRLKDPYIKGKNNANKIGERLKEKKFSDKKLKGK